MTTTASDGKTTAIIAYMTIIGLVIAFVMNSSEKTDLASYHIRNMIGLCLMGVGNSVLGYIGMPSFITWIISVFIVFLWVMGLVGALAGEKKEIPFLGAHFQNWFKGV
tara:strand:+ start:1116 stop:1439 length:324 start_codon:yes stop_codon:yes gene_type:complete